MKKENFPVKIMALLLFSPKVEFGETLFSSKFKRKFTVNK